MGGSPTIGRLSTGTNHAIPLAVTGSDHTSPSLHTHRSTGMRHADNWRESHLPDLGYASVHRHEQHRVCPRPLLPLGRLLVQGPAVASAAPVALQDPDNARSGALPLPLPLCSTRRPLPPKVVSRRNLQTDQQQDPQESSKHEGCRQVQPAERKTDNRVRLEVSGWAWINPNKELGTRAVAITRTLGRPSTI